MGQIPKVDAEGSREGSMNKRQNPERCTGTGKEKMSELKPCPFCGREAEVKVVATTLSARAMCAKCNVVMKKNYKGNKKIESILEELIKEDWNRRAEYD